jgi:isopenicillin N synthase-like dioxygenase
MTILRMDDAPGGLQVQSRDGHWLDVHAGTGSFVVNLGDMMARWTNDRWPATLHRVSIPPADRAAASRRQTIVFFHDPRPDAVVECIPSCADPAYPPRYAPVTALEHIQSKAAKALA